MIKSSEDAVSPVVGVMLMLVVTIIIAAVVSGFAGGLTGNTQVAPTAVLDVELYATHTNSMGSSGVCYSPLMVIEHKSGDALPTKDLKIITYFTNASGVLLTGGLDGREWGNPDETIDVSSYIVYEGTPYASDYEMAPMYLSDMNRYYYAYDEPGCWFGNESAILRSGDVMTTLAEYAINTACTTVNDPGLSYIISGGDEHYDLADTDFSGWQTGATVDVKILHVPSGNYIFDKEVYVK